MAFHADRPWIPTREQLELIASLLDAGVTVEHAFTTLSRMATSRPTRTAAGTVAQRIGEGVGIAAALAEVGAPSPTVALLSAGERTGRAADALRAAGDLAGRTEALRTMLRRAVIYPGVVLGVGVGMLTLIALTVVPQLERTFLDLGGELPLATRIVLSVSAVLRSVWIAAAAAAVVLLRRPLRAAVEHAGVPARLRAIPGLRRFHADIAVAVIARLIATMLAGGVPFVDALREAARAMASGTHRERLRRAVTCVERGGSAFEDEALGPLIGPVDREILAVAERTGILSAQWAHVADRRAEALDERIARIGAIVEPLLVVLVGALVGGAVISLYLPTFRVLDLI